MEEIDKMQKVHLPGLNGIRAIASLVVLFGHIDEYLYLFGLTSLGLDEHCAPRYGVTLFFVLSGFLITYLLLIEKHFYNKINIVQFYFRRILRIWPLYFLIIFISPFILVLFGINPLTKLSGYLMYVLFIPNVAFALNRIIPGIPILWSIGVEEQFYLFWPWVIGKSEKPIKAIVSVILIYFLVKLILHFFNHNELILLTRIDCMAIGGVGAYLSVVHFDKCRIIFNKWIQGIAWISIGSILLFPIYKPDFFINELYSCLFTIVIMNISLNNYSLIKLNNGFWNFVGKLSYGVYIYHVPVLFISSYFLKNKFSNSPGSIFGIFLIVITCTYTIAYLSYNYFEMKFLLMKGKYSKVLSSP